MTRSDYSRPEGGESSATVLLVAASTFLSLLWIVLETRAFMYN
jgi:hypothetical protein